MNRGYLGWAAKLIIARLPAKVQTFLQIFSSGPKLRRCTFSGGILPIFRRWDIILDRNDVDRHTLQPKEVSPLIDYQALGQKIRQLRRIENLTQEELAQKLGVSISFVGHLERGTRTASLETLLSLCAVLKTTPNDLLTDSLPIKEDAHAHTGLTSEQRKQLKEFLRMAQSALEEWEEWEE